MTSPRQELLETLGAHLPENLLATLRREFERADFTERKVVALEEMLRLRRIAKYGPGSESLTNAQLELLESEPGVSSDEVRCESQRDALPVVAAAEESAEGKKKRRVYAQGHPGRQGLPAGLERELTHLAAPVKPCGGCGGATTVIGHDEAERLDVRPPQYFVAVTRREKRACPHCPGQGVSMAAVPANIIPKGIASDRVVLDVVVAKYCDHNPLYRQSVILARESGVEISRVTLDDWVMRVGELLRPVSAAMAAGLRAAPYLQADETPVGVQTHDRRGKNHQAYLWQYGRPGGEAVFDFRMGRAADGPKEFLGNYEGILQTDGYTGYNDCGGPKLVRAACWAHARRKFVDAVKLSPADQAAIAVVAAMDALFALDRQARRDHLDEGQRHKLRESEAPARLAAIRAAVERAGGSALTGNALAKAVRYTLALWPRLVLFLKHPVLELSTNLAENSMRPIALGRKNWIHIGGVKAAPRVAAILSVMESCRRIGMPVRPYLADILPRLANETHSQFAQFTPSAWRLRHP